MKHGVAMVVVACLVATPSVLPGGIYVPPPGDHAPVWSPDGTAIVYLAQGAQGRTLRVIAPDGSGDRQLPIPSLGYVGPTPFVFSPDWFWIAFAQHELVVSRPDGSGRHSLSNMLFAALPAWSPDGRRLAFPRTDGLYTIDVDGSNLRRLTEGGIHPAWSPDGGLIAFAAGPPGRLGVHAIRPDGSDERVLTEELPGRHQLPAWSPDGTRIAFLTNLDDGTWRVTVATRDGDLVRQFEPPSPTPYLAWSPDGGRLLLSGTSVSLADLATGQLALLVPFGATATWAPNGAEIAFDGGGECKDRSAIYRLELDGSPPVRLTNDCRIRGTAGADRLRGTELADVILGLGGDDFVAAWDPAYTGDDVYGGAGDDTLTGGAQGDRLEGGSGADRIEALAGPDLVRGGPGRDLLEGDGGKDYLDAEDGMRDEVRCGTNRSRGTGPELDTAFVDRLDTASGCELLYRNGRANLRAGRIALAVTTSRGGERSTWTLRCRPVGGSLPDAGEACRRLATMRGPLAPVPYDRLCTPLSQPTSTAATVRGVFAGRRVGVQFWRHDSCEVERWDRHRFLLDPVRSSSAAASTELRIVAWPSGPGEGGARVWRLRCNPTGGTLPRPATACTRLAALERPFAPVPKDVGCTQIFGGPQVARVIGVYGGRRVWVTFRRTDGCEIARWNRHRFLFPIATGPS